MMRILEKSWNNVVRRDVLEVRFTGRFVQVGTVDDCSPDGDFVWLLDSLGDRRLLHGHDGYDLVKVDR